MLIFELASLASDLRLYRPDLPMSPALFDAILYNLAEAFKRCYGYRVAPDLIGGIDYALADTLSADFNFDGYVYSGSCVHYLWTTRVQDFRMKRLANNVVVIYNDGDPNLHNFRIK